MGGLLAGILSPALTATSQAVAGRQSGEIQGIMTKIKEERQAKEDALKAVLQGAQVRNLDSEVFSREHPKPTYDPDRGVTVDVQHGTSSPVAGITPKPHAPVEGSDDWLKAVIAKTQAESKYGYHAPDRSLVVTLGPDGQRVYTPRPDAAGKQAPAPTGSGGGSRSLTPEAIQGMYDQAQHADEVMRQYENDYRAGKVKVHTGSQTLGSGTGAHSTGVTALLAGGEAAASNALLGVTDPRYQAYLTAQKRFGNIMGNLMSKRYSEYQGTLDTQLAGLSAVDAIPTLDLKQSYRGDLLKSRPPAAVSPLGQGHSGASDPGGNIDLGKTSKTPSASQRQRAGTDPEYKEFLIEHGYKF